MTAFGGFLWAAACFLVVTGPLIFLHEMGHYLVGRWCGVKAEAFSIGFGRELFGWNDKRGTRWKVSVLPLGGYVRFAGDMNPASQPSPEWLALPAEERRKTFQAKAIWQRFLIVLAGPAMNFLIAIVIFGGLLAHFGEPFIPTVVSGVVPHSAAAEAGIRPGDAIVSIDGESMRRFQDVSTYVAMRPDAEMQVTVQRGAERLAFPVHVRASEVDNGLGQKLRIGALGIRSGQGAMRPVSLLDLPARSVSYGWATFKITVTSIVQVLDGDRSTKDLNGPIGVARIAGATADLGWFAILALMAGISINLGFINLLPIPMLDGGHLLFYIVEAVRRRPVEPQVQEWAFRSGLALLLGLMLFVTFNDIGSTGLWQRLAGLMG